MKTRFLAIAMLTLGSVSLVACQKDAAEKQPEQKQIDKCVSLSSDEISSRTAFDPATGKVTITGSEKIHVYYAQSENATQMYEAQTASAQKEIPLAAADAGLWTCSFQHNDLGASAYDYFFVLPYSDKSSIVGAGVSQHVLPAEQFPNGSVSFDSNADILIGRPLTLAATEQTSSQSANFARLFVPLRMRLVDANAMIGAEKINSVEFSAATTDAPLTGTYKVTHARFEKDILKECTTAGKGVKASYADGLAGVDGVFTVWYIVNSTTLHDKMTIKITTDTRTLTCMVDSKDYEILPTEINLIAVTLKPANTTVAVDEVDLKKEYEAGNDITIGGVTINKSTYGEALTPAAGTTLSSPTNQSVYFLDNGVYTLNSAGRQVLIAKNGAKPVVEYTGIKTIGGNFICKGITLQPAAGFTAGYAFNVGGTTVDYFVWDGCKIVSGVNLSYFSGAGAFKNMIIRNCTFKFIPSAEFGALRILNFGSIKQTNIANIEKVEFTNNTVYSQKTVNGCVFIADQTRASTTEYATKKAEIIVNNNTFINFVCNSCALVTIANAKSVECRNNMFWMGTTGYTSNSTSYLFKFSELPSPQPSFMVNTNFKYIANANLSLAMYPANGPWMPELELPDGDNKVDPFEGGVFSFETETFTPADAYKMYGIQAK